MLELTWDLGVDLARSDARHGYGLFETCRLEGGRVRWLRRHRARLAQGCALLGLPEPPPLEVLEAFLADRLPERGGLRLLAVDGRLGVVVDPAPPPLRKAPTLGVAQGVRRLAGSLGTCAKLLSYAENRLLHREAEARGLFDVVALNEQGRLTDGGRTSLVLMCGEEVLTPAAADGALPGIAREVLLEAGLVREAGLGPEDLAEAQGILLVNALRGGLLVRADAGGRLAACVARLAARTAPPR